MGFCCRDSGRSNGDKKMQPGQVKNTNHAKNPGWAFVSTLLVLVNLGRFHDPRRFIARADGYGIDENGMNFLLYICCAPLLLRLTLEINKTRYI